MHNLKQLEKPILFYDHECNLCNRFKISLERLGVRKRVEMISIHEDGIFDKYKVITKEECEKEVHLLKTNGEILKGHEVINFLVKEFPGVSKFSWLIESQIGQTASKIFHDAASKYRESLLNRCPKCKKTKRHKSKSCEGQR